MGFFLFLFLLLVETKMRKCETKQTFFSTHTAFCTTNIHQSHSRVPCTTRRKCFFFFCSPNLHLSVVINFCPCLKVSLLGDADSIVTYLSSRLGWPIPPPTVLPTPPSAVGEGKSEDTAPAGQKDEIKVERATHMVIPPEEAQWLTVDEE